jgi:hypothetical protein
MRRIALRSTGLWRTVIARLRADWAVVAAAWALLICATTLLTAGTLYGDAVALGGIRAAIAAAPPAERGVVVKAAAVASGVAALDAPVRTELERIIARTGGEVVAVTRTEPFARITTDPVAVNEVLTFGSFQGIEGHAELVDGRWATAGAARQEATLSEGAASTLGLLVGGEITLVNRLDAGIAVPVVIVGIWRASPDDPYWLASGQEIDGVAHSGVFTTVGPFIVPDADLAARSFGARRDLEWRALPDPTGYRFDDLDAIGVDARQLITRLGAALPSAAQFRIETRLPDILTSVTRSALVSRTGVLLLVVQFAVLAAYAILLVAGMLADRRRAETALLRSRGASTGHLAAMTIFEAVLLAGMAAAIAPFLSLGVVRWLSGSGPLAASGIGATVGLSRDALAVDVLTALACVVALTIPMLGGFPSLAGVRATIGRQAGRTLAQRLGLDLALVVVAGIALWQLRLYGAPLTRNARGVLGVDPLLVAAPGIGLLAGAVVATRMIPRIAEVAERLLQRDRGLVSAMGGRGLARRPLRYTRSALLLMLAAALGTFATAHEATWTRSQADQAAYQAGADLRVSPSQGGPPAGSMAQALRSVDGVTAVMSVDRLTVDSGRGVRGGPLLALDAAVSPDVIKPTPDADGAAIPGFLAQLAARPAPMGGLVPDDARQIALRIDARFEGTYVDPAPGPDLTAFEGIRASFIIQDGDGRVFRLISDDGAFLSGADQRLAATLPTNSTTPIRVWAVEIGLSAPPTVGLTGALEVQVLQATTAEPGQRGGVEWTALDIRAGDPGWDWDAKIGTAPRVAVRAQPGAPWQVNVGGGSPWIDPIYGDAHLTTVVRLAVASAPEPVAAIAGREFLAATGAQVGETVPATWGAGRHSVRIVGVIDTFPTIDPAQPFLIVDGPTLGTEGFVTLGSVSSPGEWWLKSTDAEAAAASILARLDPAADIVSRPMLEETLLTDPVPLGVIGVLGLGSAAAMLFAAIGFIVAATISTRERVGEFALFRALGLSGRELSLWLWLEHAFLVVVGVATGLGLGVLLAHVVLPVSTLTASGTAAIPSPIVELPAGSLLPVVAVAGIVFLLTMLVLRGQLLHIRLGHVLRASDE